MGEWDSHTYLVAFSGEYFFKAATLHSPTYVGFPLNAAWCRALKPLLFVTVMSAVDSSSNVNMSSRFLLMAS